MSRFRRDNTDDALELFLDAISNAFGGILFIALAVVILLQFTTPTPTDAEVSEPVASAPQASAELEAEIASLESLMTELVDQPVKEGRDEDFHERAEKVKEQVKKAAEELDALEAQREAAELALKESDRRLALLGKELLEVEAALRDAQRRPPDRVRAERFRETAKVEVPVMLKAGRLVEVMEFGADGAARGVNKAALRIDVSAQRAEPAPGAGVLVAAGEPGKRQATAVLARFDPGRHYVAIAVWPDSFAAAALLRDAAIDMGFDFGLTPIPAGQGVPFGAASGVQ